MAETRTYLVRDAGRPGRPGKVFRVYPYSLRALIEAIDDARFRSLAFGPQELLKADGAERTVIRRFEGGHEAAV